MSARRLLLGCTILTTALAGVDLGWVKAQDSQPAIVQHVPQQTIASVSLWPKQIAAGSRMRMLPMEVLSAAGLENVGIDPLLLDRVDVLVGLPGPAGPQFGALIHSSQELSLKQIRSEILDEQGLLDDGGFQYVQLRGPEEIIVHQLDSQTALLGTKIFVGQMVKAADRQAAVAQVLANIRSQQDGLAIVSVATLQPLLQGFVAGAPVPGEIAQDLKFVLEETEFLALRVLVAEEDKLQLVLWAHSEDGARDLQASLQNLLAFAQEQIVADFRTLAQDDSLTNQAMLKYIDRMGTEVQSLLRPQQSENRVVLEVDDIQGLGSMATLTGLLMPAIQSARMAARRMQSSNNLKQLGLALHNFASAYGSFPATAGLDDDGQPMLSWRVAILPFIEEAELYGRFNLDEAWDSDHNLALLEEMPDVFKHPTRRTQPGHTVYQAPVGDETLLRLKEPTRFQEITDGTSNTLLLVETVADRAVPWTAPRDYEVNLEDPSAGLFINGVAEFLFGDGSVQSIAETVDAGLLRALFTRAGGEVVERP